MYNCSFQIVLWDLCKDFLCCSCSSDIEQFVKNYMTSRSFPKYNRNITVNITDSGIFGVSAPDYKSYTFMLYDIKCAFEKQVVPADAVYCKILEDTVFDSRINYQDFIKNVEKSGRAFMRKEVSDNAIESRYFIKKRSVEGFIQYFYGRIYNEVKDGFEYRRHAGYSLVETRQDVYLPDMTFYGQSHGSIPYRIATFSNQFYMEPKNEYNPIPAKINTLQGLAKTLIKNQLKLVAEQNAEQRVPGREAKIKDKMMSTLDTLVSQSEYVKKYFNKDINALVARYKNGDLPSVDDVLVFFDIHATPVVPTTAICGNER